MSQYKRQHYVPVFLLKNFSCNAKTNLINIFNIKSNRFIEGKSSIKKQCYEDYLYGKDGNLEFTLSKCEEKWSQILESIQDRESVPLYLKKNPEIFIHIIMFILIQDLRNLSSIDHIRKVIQTYTHSSTRIKYDSNLVLSLIEKDAAVKLNMSEINDKSFWLSDLHVKLIKNETLIPFFIGDNPIVFYNKLFENDDSSNVNHLGDACYGLIIFAPISPKYVLCLYDNNVYKIGKKDNSLIIVDKDEETKELNKLQILNASQNIYYSFRCCEDYRELLKKQALARKPQHYVEQRQVSNQSAIMFGRVNFNTSLNLSFIKFRKHINKNLFIRPNLLRFFSSEMLDALHNYLSQCK